MEKAGYIFAVVIGFCMIIMWGMLLATGQVVEMKAEPLRIAAHLSSEFITAIALIIGGIASMKLRPWGEKVHLVSLGALVYSVLTAGGYYAQKGNPIMSIMFAVFFLAAIVFICAAVKRRNA